MRCESLLARLVRLAQCATRLVFVIRSLLDRTQWTSPEARPVSENKCAAMGAAHWELLVVTVVAALA